MLHPVTTRALLAAGLVALAAMSLGATAAPAAAAGDYAVYEEHSPETKPMQPGPNIRVLNRVIAQSGGAIALDTESGTVSLAPGTYRISGGSVLTYFDPEVDVDGKVSARARPNAGYAQLQYPDRLERGEIPLALGTMATANMVPSLIDTILHFDEPAQIVLLHQAGRDVDGIYLQVYVDDSDRHVMARLVIERID